MSKEILLKREDIGHCRHCDKTSSGVEFRGAFNRYDSHLKSEDGWWLRIDHDMGWLNEPRGKDTVGELLCPDCHVKESDRLSALLDL